MKRINTILCVFLILGMVACTSAIPTPSPDETVLPKITQTQLSSSTPFLPSTNTPAADKKINVYLPSYFQESADVLFSSDQVEITPELELADCELVANKFSIPEGEIIFALVAPFNTIRDGFSSEEFNEIYTIDTQNNNPSAQLVISEESAYFLNKNSNAISGKLNSLSQFQYAIIPFEETIPAFKVMAIDGISPFDQDFNSTNYALTIPIGFECSQKKFEDRLRTQITGMFTNRDSNKFTSVLVTGTTALTRAIGAKMEQNGMQYPGEKVKMWFDSADISHISNEVSFNETCPPADPYQKDLRFCSRSEYVQLFTYLGVDVVELSGNHLIDRGVEALDNTFQILDQLGIPYYAAGTDLVTAEKAVRFETNGNKISFLGCNSAGPDFVFLSATHSGVLACDMDRMAELVKNERQSGFLPIVTFQYGESFQFEAQPNQRRDFQAMVDAGAVIVSGSQAHLPMSMEIYNGQFIHFGLGNLFFDQMDIPVVGTRREFLDRHIFYDGKFLGVQLYTAMLEDYSQPRPMTDLERENLLRDAFEYFQIIGD